jgi:hypothetical protein
LRLAFFTVNHASLSSDVNHVGGAAARGTEAIDKLGELIGCDMLSPSLSMPRLRERQERLNPESMFMFSTLINVSESAPCFCSSQFTNGAHVLFRAGASLSFVYPARPPPAAPLRVFT